MKTKHRHKWELSSYQYPPSSKYLRKSNWPEIGFRCKCGETLKRPMTQDEIKEYRNKSKESAKRTKELHGTWHKFIKTFGGKGEWKLKGYDFMYAVEKYAEKNPEITVVGCDDAHFASSSIVLVPHKTGDYYMGTTMLIIPQLVGEIVEVFLYPGHADALIEALKTLPKGDKPDWEKLRKKNLRRLISRKKLHY